MLWLSNPVKVPDIPKIEHDNQIYISGLGYEDDEVIAVCSTTEQFDNHMNLSMISDGKKSHYCWIKDLNRLLKDKKYNTHRLLSSLTVSMDLLKEHISYCQINCPQNIELPTEEVKWISYTNISKQLDRSGPMSSTLILSILLTNWTHALLIHPHSYIEKLTRHVQFFLQVGCLKRFFFLNSVVYRVDMFILHILKIKDRLDFVYKNPNPLK